MITDVYTTTGFDGKPRKGSDMVCTNPIHRHARRGVGRTISGR